MAAIGILTFAAKFCFIQQDILVLKLNITSDWLHQMLFCIEIKKILENQTRNVRKNSLCVC